MELSTGKISFPLHFDNGDIENVFINPHDKGLQERIRNFEASIKSRMDKINFEKYKDAFSNGVDARSLDFEKMMEMSEEELEKISKTTTAITEIDEELEREFCAELDKVFDGDISKKAFKYVPPLAVVPTENGDCELYIVLVLKALAVEIQKYGEKMSKTTNKYVAKYQKNK